MTDPRSLLDRLAELYPESNKTRFRQWLKAGRVEVDGQVVTDSRHPADRNAEIRLRQEGVGTMTGGAAASRRIRGGTIVYEDVALIVIDKEAGILTVPAPGGRPEQSLVGTLRQYLGREPYIVHRLDRDTSGIVIFAKTVQAKQTLQEDWSNAVEDRRYVALVEGKLIESEGTLRSFLKENRAHRVYATDESDEGAKLALLHYRVLRSGTYSLVEIELETGRKNQIRAQFEELGHPVAGDSKYGATTDPLRRLALHARSIRFRHPSSGEMLAFESPAPPGFR